MQIDCSTGEVYASCEAIAPSETIDLMTVAPHSYSVFCWVTLDEEVRWSKDFGSDLKGAVEEYNKWAKVPERVPTFN